MATRTTVLLAVLGLGACATTYSLRPAAGGETGRSSAGGITLLADAEAWSGQPYDLPNYLTPIAVRISNRGASDVRINYADFSLVDEQGFRYSAINPYTGTSQQAPVGSAGEPAPDVALVLPPWAREPAAEARCVQATPVAAHVAGRTGHVVVERGQRFFVHPPARYAFRYYDPWPYGWAEPPYYGTYVYPWNDSYYPGTPSNDVLRLGLPEGVVRAGGQISGFLYFQNASQRANNLRLTWTVRGPDGKTVAVLHVPFVVVTD